MRPNEGRNSYLGLGCSRVKFVIHGSRNQKIPPTKNTACNLQVVCCVLGRELIIQVRLSPTCHQEPVFPTVEDVQFVGFSVRYEKYRIKQLHTSQNEANFTIFSMRCVSNFKIFLN